MKKAKYLYKFNNKYTHPPPILFIPPQLLLSMFLLQYHHIVVTIEWCVLEECYTEALLQPSLMYGQALRNGYRCHHSGLGMNKGGQREEEAG